MRSSRMLTKNLPVMPQPKFGKGTTLLPIEKLKKEAMEKIHPGVQIVDLPMMTERHAFLIDIQPNEIMISDWGGEINRYRGCEKIQGKKNKFYDARFINYTQLIQFLTEEYSLPIIYYPVDEYLYREAEFCHNRNNHGGCSIYIFAWAKIYYPNYIL